MVSHCSAHPHIHAHMKRRNKKQPVNQNQSPMRSISFKSAFWIVLALHLLVGVSLFGYSSKPSAKADDSKYVNPTTTEYAGVPEPTPIPTPTPSPTPEYVKKVMPDGKIATYPIPKKEDVKPVVSSKYTKEYVVKRGDTFYSIVKRYKLNPDKLIELNNIKDTSKLKEGQVLKFM
jgi:LysM repeat protein